MMQDAFEVPDGWTLNPDVCIVGAGAAGIAMGLELIGSGIEVLLLESGGPGFERDTQALYSGAVADLRLHRPLHRDRERRFGGSTTVWDGRCAPFDPIDFEARGYITHSGWPFSRDELLPHYARANQLCEAGDFAYTTAEALAAPHRAMIDNFCSASFSSHTLERFSCPTDFGVRYAQRLRAAANVRVLLHANVTGLRLNPAGSAVDRLTVRTLAGRSFTVDAAQVVIATGGLEAARLLLANRDVHRNGIGNDHDVVGRYYMCQMTATLGSLTMAGPPGAVWHGYDIADDGAYCRRRLAVLPEAQRALRIGNISARLHHPRMDDPEHRSGILSLLHLARCLIPRDRAQRAHDGDGAELRLWTQHLRNVVGDSFSTLSLGWRLLCDRLLAERKLPSLIIAPANQCYRLDLHAEQQPNPSSRVTLDQERDALGQPRLRIDWRYLGADVGTVQRTLSLFAQEIERARVGRFRYDPETVEQELIRQGACSGHHIGTARMGSDPLSSVTNAHGRVHGVDNLFVAGAALFPTSSQAAPTLTIVALALRMAQHLRRRHAREALATQYTTRVLPDLQTRLEAAA